MRHFLPLIVLVFSLASCQEALDGNGNVKRETRETAPFESVDISGVFEVRIKKDNYSSLVIEADENLLEHIESYVQGGTLHLSQNKTFVNYKKLVLYVNMKELERLEASGAAEITSQGVLTGRDISLDFSGGVEADLELVCEKLDADLSGACEVRLRGKAEKASYNCSGAVEIKALDFKTAVCDLEMSGAGEAEVYVTKELNVDVSGAAEIRYAGSPGNVKQDVSGVANIEPISE